MHWFTKFSNHITAKIMFLLYQSFVDYLNEWTEKKKKSNMPFLPAHLCYNNIKWQEWCQLQAEQ